MQSHRAEVAATLKRFEEKLENTETSSEDRKRFHGDLSAKKQELEALAAEEQQQQATAMEAEERLRAEQANSADSKTGWNNWRRPWVAIRNK